MSILGKITRRGVLTQMATIVAASALPPSIVSRAIAAEQPQRGGTLLLGVGGGYSSNSLDPRTITDIVPQVVGHMLMNSLIEIGAQGELIPELAESWEPAPDAANWQIQVRRDITFHNGKTLDADDVIYSLNLHRGETKSGAQGIMQVVTSIKKIDSHRISISLETPDMDFPYTLTDYHLLIVPNEFNAWDNPIGTGAFTLETWQPGLRAVMKGTGDYWKPDRGHLDAVDLTVINDGNARVNALITNQVHAINSVTPRSVGMFANVPTVQLVHAKSRYHGLFAMRANTPPFDNNDARLALKYAIDRTAILETVMNGFATIGNDHPIPSFDPYFNTELVQRPYDADQAKFHADKAGLSGVEIQLAASEAAFTGSVDAATVFQASARKAGIALEVRREPQDAYWSNVWMKVPFFASVWAGRPAATQQLAVAYRSTAPWNETAWSRNTFDQLLADAKSELDDNKRKDYIWEMQRMIHEDGGAITPLFLDRLGACLTKVGGYTPHVISDLDNNRIGEKAWLRA